MDFKTKAIAGFFFFLTIGTSAVFAQIGQDPAQQNQVQIEVSDAELDKFAQAFQRIRMINQEAQKKLTEVVQEGGMEIQRFNKIHQAKMDPAVEVNASDEEEKQYSDISSEIEKIQMSFQTRMEEVIKEQGLPIEKYQQIATQLQTDPELQERLRAVFQD